jgi:hypothetical protein
VDELKELLAALSQLTRAISADTKEEERNKLLIRARRLVPPATWPELAKATGMSEGGVRGKYRAALKREQEAKKR